MTPGESTIIIEAHKAGLPQEAGVLLTKMAALEQSRGLSARDAKAAAVAKLLEVYEGSAIMLAAARANVSPEKQESWIARNKWKLVGGALGVGAIAVGGTIFGKPSKANPNPHISFPDHLTGHVSDTAAEWNKVAGIDASIAKSARRAARKKHADSVVAARNAQNPPAPSAPKQADISAAPGHGRKIDMTPTLPTSTGVTHAPHADEVLRQMAERDAKKKMDAKKPKAPRPKKEMAAAVRALLFNTTDPDQGNRYTPSMTASTIMRKGQRYRMWVGRSGNFTNDVADTLSGKQRKPGTKREWEKSWFKNAAAAAALGGGITLTPRAYQWGVKKHLGEDIPANWGGVISHARTKDPLTGVGGLKRLWKAASDARKTGLSARVARTIEFAQKTSKTTKARRLAGAALVAGGVAAMPAAVPMLRIQARNLTKMPEGVKNAKFVSDYLQSAENLGRSPILGAKGAVEGYRISQANKGKDLIGRKLSKDAAGGAHFTGSHFRRFLTGGRTAHEMWDWEVGNQVRRGLPAKVANPGKRGFVLVGKSQPIADRTGNVTRWEAGRKKVHAGIDRNIATHGDSYHSAIGRLGQRNDPDIDYYMKRLVRDKAGLAKSYAGKAAIAPAMIAGGLAAQAPSKKDRQRKLAALVRQVAFASDRIDPYSKRHETSKRLTVASMLAGIAAGGAAGAWAGKKYGIGAGAAGLMGAMSGGAASDISTQIRRRINMRKNAKLYQARIDAGWDVRQALDVTPPPVRHFDSTADQRGWDLRDARGKSARVFAPGSRRRERREKEWGEKVDNIRKVRNIAIVAAAGGLTGSAILGLRNRQLTRALHPKPAPGWDELGQREAEAIATKIKNAVRR
jgi:hypothetical protein